MVGLSMPNFWLAANVLLHTGCGVPLAAAAMMAPLWVDPWSNCSRWQCLIALSLA